MSIRAFLADDEPLARQRLARLLSEHPDLELLGEAADGHAALEQVLALRPRLLFLDVNMPLLNGVAVLERINELLPEGQRPLTVFTTAYEEHALRAIELDGLDYLVKPVEAETLARALRRARARLGESPAPVEPAPAPAPAEEPLEHLAALRGEKILRLDLSKVAAILLEDTICYALTPAGRFRLKQSLGELEARLPSPPFLRISRAALVSLDWVAQLEPLVAGRCQLSLKSPPGDRLEVSRRRVKRLKELLGY
jgi:DNA-binding LytR/AlgR family response regulator